MKNIFINLFNMSITASWFILAILLFRLIFKKAPKWIVCILWCLVGVRLICPFSIESRFSFLPKENSVSDIYVHESYRENDNSDVVLEHDEDIVTYKTNSSSKTQATINKVAGNNHVTKHYKRIDFSICSYIWVIGLGLFSMYGIIMYIKLKLSLKDAVRYDRKIYQTEGIDTAFVIGILNPIIYIPYGLGGEQLNCVIKHEQAHISRRDHLIKPIGYILLFVYWFNPIIWLAYIMFCHDIELACDEKVIREMGYDKKKLYTQTILDCSSKRKKIVASPVAFAEIGVKERVVEILKIKKAKKSIVVVSLVVCGIVALGFMTSPLRTNANENNFSEPVYETTEEITTEEVTTQDVETEKQSTTETSEDETNKESDVLNPSNSDNDDKEPKDDRIDDSKSVDSYYDQTINGGTFAWPVSTGGIITSPFGPRFGSLHDGLDIATPEGTPIVSAIEGTVIDVGYDSEIGNYIDIEREDGLKVSYHHLNEVISKVGDVVCQYEVVALSGCTGNSTGPHLHMGVFSPSGEAIDPYVYLYEP